MMSKSFDIFINVSTQPLLTALSLLWQVNTEIMRVTVCLVCCYDVQYVSIAYGLVLKDRNVKTGFQSES